MTTETERQRNAVVKLDFDCMETGMGARNDNFAVKAVLY